MHKSLGNGVDPADIIKEFGADMIRLWAGSSDYHVDVRCSKEIFRQLSQNYLKFRNTARYCLGNLDGFDADALVAPEEMLPLDRWAVTKLNALIAKADAAYDNYEFHVVSHAINDFCVVELSSFYLDIIKDRLYCEEKNGLKRRSAQTALFLILDSMTRMFAPILAFTCDEIWQAMPHRSEDDPRNVLLNEMNKPFSAYALSADEPSPSVPRGPRAASSLKSSPTWTLRSSSSSPSASFPRTSPPRMRSSPEAARIPRSPSP